jgi:hypothetical protein
MGGFMVIHKKYLFSATLFLAASFSLPLRASSFSFSIVGPGVSGTISLTYGTSTDAKYPQAFEVTGVSGTFTDTNIGIVNAAIGMLEPVKHDAPQPTNLLAPHDFSRFAVASGLPPESNGVVTYDNLYWPGGSPQTASDYPFHGGFLDIYGLMFDIGQGRVVDIWSNGVLPGSDHPDYGVAVATSNTPLDYVSGGATITPEPSALALLGSGLAAILMVRRRAARKS